MIDNKGRIFGKINIIDLLFLLILLVALIGGFFRFRNSAVSVEKTAPGKMTMLIDNVRTPTVENIQEGQDLYHYDKGVFLGKIVGKRVVPFEKEVDYEGTWVKAEVPDRYTVYIDLDVNVTESDKSYRVGGEEIRVGNEYRVKSKQSSFSGVCVGIRVDGE